MTLQTFELDVERHRLDNGLKVNLHRDPALPLVTVNLWYHVGSKNERPGRTGFAHLFEHMLFQGSEHVDTNDHFRYIQQVGGVVNGSTWYDRTNYYETLPSRNLGLGLWLESDRMGFLLPALTEEKLENQRSVVMNERRQRVDNRPYGIAHERLHELLYPETFPYHWPVIGYMDDIAAATMDDVRAFFSTYYAPNNAVLTIAGDFDRQEALDLVSSYFGPIPAAPLLPRVAPVLTPLGGERREVIEDAVQLPRVYVGYRAPAYGDPGWYAADLLATTLASGKSSPLYRDLVHDRQIAQDVAVQVLPTELAATFFAVATCMPGVKPEVVEAAIHQHLEAAMNPLPEMELERAKNQVLSSLFQDVQVFDRRADVISEMTTYFDDPHRINTEAQEYFRIQPDAITAFVKTYLQPQERVVLTFIPKDGTTA